MNFFEFFFFKKTVLKFSFTKYKKTNFPFSNMDNFFFFFENTMFQRTMDDSLSAKQVLRPGGKSLGQNSITTRNISRSIKG